MMQPKLSAARFWRCWPWWRNWVFRWQGWHPNLRRFKKLFLFLVVGAGLILAFVRLPFFQISEVLVTGSLTVETTSRVKDLATKKSLGQNFFLLSTSELEKDLRANFPILEEIKVKMTFPCKLVLEVSSREPMAVVEFVSRQNVLGQESLVKTSYLLDRQGVYFALAQDLAGKFLVIEAGEKPPPGVGDKASAPVLAALEIIQGVGEEFTNLDKLRLVGDEKIEVTAGDGLTLIFSPKNPLAPQLATLRKVWEKYKMENKTLSRVDLRYANPVVSFR